MTIITCKNLIALRIYIIMPIVLTTLIQMFIFRRPIIQVKTFTKSFLLVKNQKIFIYKTCLKIPTTTKKSIIIIQGVILANNKIRIPRQSQVKSVRIIINFEKKFPNLFQLRKTKLLPKPIGESTIFYLSNHYKYTINMFLY